MTRTPKSHFPRAFTPTEITKRPTSEALTKQELNASKGGLAVLHELGNTVNLFKDVGAEHAHFVNDQNLDLLPAHLGEAVFLDPAHRQRCTQDTDMRKNGGETSGLDGSGSGSGPSARARRRPTPCHSGMHGPICKMNRGLELDATWHQRLLSR